MTLYRENKTLSSDNMPLSANKGMLLVRKFGLFANKILYVFRKHCLCLKQRLFLHVAKAVFTVCKNYFCRLKKPFLQRCSEILEKQIGMKQGVK